MTHSSCVPLLFQLFFRHTIISRYIFVDVQYGVHQSDNSHRTAFINMGLNTAVIITNYVVVVEMIRHFHEIP